jgi:hypothetical protein
MTFWKRDGVPGLAPDGAIVRNPDGFCLPLRAIGAECVGLPVAVRATGARTGAYVASRIAG